MPYQLYKSSPKYRLLISGLSNSGKTWSLRTFIYGHYDYNTDRQAALDYADAQGKKMIVLVCPGEKGSRSLLNTPYITNYDYNIKEGADMTKVQWSYDAIKDFNDIVKYAVDQKPDILVCDGLQSLHGHYLNRSSGGLYLSGLDMSQGGSFQSARFYSQAHVAFTNLLDYLSDSPIPIFVATTREDWQAGNEVNDAGKSQPISAKRYLWPSLPGKMALEVSGHFDARVSATSERECLHDDCEDNKKNVEHHVWQFLSKNDVRGVGVKGLHPTRAMLAKPWIHQNWAVLEDFRRAYSK